MIKIWMKFNKRASDVTLYKQTKEECLEKYQFEHNAKQSRVIFSNANSSWKGSYCLFNLAIIFCYFYMNYDDILWCNIANRVDKCLRCSLRRGSDNSFQHDINEMQHNSQVLSSCSSLHWTVNMLIWDLNSYSFEFHAILSLATSCSNDNNYKKIWNCIFFYQ